MQGRDKRDGPRLWRSYCSSRGADSISAFIWGLTTNFHSISRDSNVPFMTSRHTCGAPGTRTGKMPIHIKQFLKKNVLVTRYRVT